MPAERAKESKFKANDLSGVYAASSPMRRAFGFEQTFVKACYKSFFDRPK